MSGTASASVSPASPPAGSAAPALARRLELADAIAIFVGIILGSGIFVAPAHVAAAAPSLPAALALWAVGGLIAACGAFCYAECGSRLPRNGGFYVYYREVYGDWLAFAGGWAALLVTYPASIAAIALLSAAYVIELVPAWGGFAAPIAVAVVLSCGALNYFGVRTGAWAQRLLTTVKVGAVVLVCVAALVASERSAAGAIATTAPSWPELTVLLTALVGILWAYDGWSDVTLIAGELREPQRNLGRAVAIGIGVLIAIYVFVQQAVMLLLGAQGAAGSERVFAAAAQVGLGPAAGALVAALVVVSTLGAVNGVVLTASRLGHAMAGDGVFLPWFGAVGRWQTPGRAIAGLVAAACIYVVASDFRGLLELFGQTIWMFYGLTAVALIVLRRRGVGAADGWRAPGGLLAPVVLVLTAVGMTASLAWKDPQRFVLGLGLVLAALPVYFGWRWLRRR